jgi:molybdopterin/thiamine biosynthesis adenylyltransferase
MARTKLQGEYNDRIYWERVRRSLAWLGEDEREQRETQERLRGATVGVAGCGGIGGALAVRLARLGVLSLKVADPDAFDYTNINRQLGATRHTIGQNKAEVVAELAHDLAGDVTVEVYPEGITVDNADEFVDGCDLVLDQMDFYLIGERYALHRAGRESDRNRCILSAWCVGWGTSLYKYTRDSMTIEERYSLPEDAEMTTDVIDRLIGPFVPWEPRFPSMDTLRKWVIEQREVPLFAATPPIAEAACVQRAALVLTDHEREPYATELPPVPAYYWYDGSTFEGELVTDPPAAQDQPEVVGAGRGDGRP